MKNKLAVLLTASLLCFSLLPTPALAISPKDHDVPPSILEQEESETLDILDDLEGSEPPAPQSYVSAQLKDPDLAVGAH